MNRLTALTLFGLFLFAITLAPAKALATSVPTFPACVSPSGELIASYNSGTFGIAGKSGSYSGKDNVYKISDQALTQCFCANDGTGIQTNWWKASQLTKEEINEFVAQGWILIPDGSVWGLTADPYLAKNSDYSCQNGGGSSGGGSSSSNGGSSSSNSNSDPSAVLGLAATGNLQIAAVLFALGVLSLSTGLIIRNK